MTRDFKIGLISGVVLAFIALIWVVTRPTLSPQARMSASSTPPSSETSAPKPKSTEPEPTPTLPPFKATMASEPPTETQLTRPEQPAFRPDIIEPNQTTEIDSTVYEKDEKITTTKYHIVLKDETLSSISQQYYGTPNQWQKIVKANAGTIKDANKITPGIKIIIPE